MYPPGLSSVSKLPPIAFITNGVPTISPFTLVMLPAQLIEVVGIILWSFIDIAIAPAFFNSFTIFNKSIS